MIYYGGHFMIYPDTLEVYVTLKVAPFLLHHSIPYALYTIVFEIYYCFADKKNKKQTNTDHRKNPKITKKTTIYLSQIQNLPHTQKTLKIKTHSPTQILIPHTHIQTTPHRLWPPTSFIKVQNFFNFLCILPPTSLRRTRNLHPLIFFKKHSPPPILPPSYKNHFPTYA